jgi:hypothetical protein
MRIHAHLVAGWLVLGAAPACQPPATGSDHLKIVVKNAGGVRRYALAYQLPTDPWELELDVRRTTTIFAAGEPTSTTRRRWRSGLRVAPAAITSDGGLQYRMFLTHARLETGEGDPTEVAVPPGLYAELELTRLGAWKGFRWVLPPGTTLADTTPLEPMLPRLYWTLPPFGIGSGARWTETSEGFNSSLTNVTNAVVQGFAPSVDRTGLDLEYTEAITAPRQPIDTVDGPVEVESGEGSGNGHVRISCETWIEKATFERRMVLRLRATNPKLPPNATMLVVLRVRAERTVPPP